MVDQACPLTTSHTPPYVVCKPWFIHPCIVCKPWLMQPCVVYNPWLICTLSPYANMPPLNQPPSRVGNSPCNDTKRDKCPYKTILKARCQDIRDRCPLMKWWGLHVQHLNSTMWMKRWTESKVKRVRSEFIFTENTFTNTQKLSLSSSFWQEEFTCLLKGVHHI